MLKALVIKSWDYPDIMRQTPKYSGIWDNIQFTTTNDGQCDFVVVLNNVSRKMTFTVPHTNIWHVTQEPPVEGTSHTRPNNPNFFRKFTPDITQIGSEFIHTHTALPWHVHKSYDELKVMQPPLKDQKLSWITSNLRYLAGHGKRLDFLDALQNEITFDLWGRGFQEIEDKWDGLAPYRYAMAVENYSGPHYWTEKIADCFLAWTMPIYYGATNIASYFPPESFVSIDITQPEEAIETIKETIQSDKYIRNREAIEYARQLVLERYQFFPFMVNHIQSFLSKTPIPSPEPITLMPTHRGKKSAPDPNIWIRILRKIKKEARRFTNG